MTFEEILDQAMPALSSGTKGSHCSRPVMCGAVAGLWLARERSVYGFLAVALCRLSA